MEQRQAQATDINGDQCTQMALWQDLHIPMVINDQGQMQQHTSKLQRYNSNTMCHKRYGMAASAERLGDKIHEKMLAWEFADYIRHCHWVFSPITRPKYN